MNIKRWIVVLALGVFTMGAALAPAAAAAKSDKADKADKAEEKAPRIKGTIKVEGHPSLDELKKRTKISQADAEKAAIKSVGAKEGAKVTYSELEIESGFLVYSIDVKVAGKAGVEEVWIDPGTGKVLRSVHESDDDEDEESATDDEEDGDE